MELKHKELSEKIIAAAYNVHKELGYGFLEKIYKNALVIADIIADDKIVIEVKAVSKLESVHEVQLVNYLKATGIEVGLLINFGQSVEVKRRIFG